jgi:hypothetical protein
MFALFKFSKRHRPLTIVGFFYAHIRKQCKSTGAKSEVAERSSTFGFENVNNSECAFFV